MAYPFGFFFFSSSYVTPLDLGLVVALEHHVWSRSLVFTSFAFAPLV